MQSYDWKDEMLQDFGQKELDEHLKQAKEELAKPEVKSILISKEPPTSGEIFRKFIERKR